MMKLYCMTGDHTWESAPLRGRPPTMCPEHYDRNAYRRVRRLNDPTSERAKDRARYERDSERIKARNLDYYHNRCDQQARNARTRERYAANLAQYRMYSRRGEGAHRARKRNQFIEHVDPQTVYQMHGGRCGICGLFIEGDFHVDHVVPLARGGMHGYINVQPAHPRCNLSKGAK